MRHRSLLIFVFLLPFSCSAATPALPAPAPAATTPLLTFRSTDEEPAAVAFSSNGSRLLSACGFELLLWDVQSGLPLRRFKLPGLFRGFTACAFSADGATVMAGSNDGKVATWNAATGTLVKVLHSEDWMYDCAFTPDRGRVLSVYQSDRVTFKEMASGRILWEKRSPGVNACAISGDARRALTASDTGMTLLETATGKILRTFDHHGNSTHYKTCALSPDGNTLACARKQYAPDFQLIDARSGKTLHTFRGHNNAIRTLDFSPDGTMIASGSADNTLKLWNTRSGALIRTFTGHHHDVLRAAFLPNGSQILSASKDLAMKLWDCRRATIPPAEHAAIRAYQSRLAELDRANGYVEPLITFSPDGYKFGIEHAAFSPDGKRIISSSFASVRIRDVSTGRILRQYSGYPENEWVQSCSFSPDGRTALTTGLHDQALKLWDARTGKTLQTLTGHESSVQDAAFSPDGSRLVSASWDKTVRIWETATGKTLLTLRDHRDEVNCCAFLPGGNAVITSSKDKTVRTFNAVDGTPLRTLRPGYEVTDFAVSPDGKRLFTVCASASDPTQTLWDLGTGKPVRILGVPGQMLGDALSTLCDLTGLPYPSNDCVHCAVFSPDGKWLATGSLDQAIRIRDAATGKLVVRVRSRAGHSEGVEAIAFSPDGRQLLTASKDGSLKLWGFQQLLASRRDKP